MARYFDYHYTGPAFDLFGPAHLTALAIIAAVITTLIAGRYDLSETAKQHARHGLIATILIVEIVYLCRGS